MFIKISALCWDPWLHLCYLLWQDRNTHHQHDVRLQDVHIQGKATDL